MKHCFLCRWSFGATEPSGDEESPLIPVLKCYPGGKEANDKSVPEIATKICAYYDSEQGGGDEQ